MRKVKMNVQERIQGVGFRYTIKMVVDQLGVTGTMKNEGDGSVAIEAVRSDDIAQEFIEEVKKSPSPSGQAQRVDVQKDPVIEE